MRTDEQRQRRAAYMREWRARTEHSLLSQRAVNRAVQRLKDTHRSEYQRYYADELGKLRDGEA